MDFSSLDLNDEKTCFRLGFLQRCQEEKLSAAQLDERIKSAAWPAALAGLGALLYGAGNAVKNTVTYGGGSLLAAGIGAPFAGGLIGGGLLGKTIGEATNPPPPDVEAERLKELADMYKIQASRMRARRAIKYRPPQGR
jgi:hypothetical protein